MDDLIELAVFTAPSLGPRLPEDCQVNPGVFGAELAYWLATELAARGIATSYPESEDWGWYIEYRSEHGAEFAVHCGNVDESREQWALHLRAFGRKWFGRDKPSASVAQPLIDGIETLLRESPEVTDLEWLAPRGSLSDAAQPAD